MEIGRGRLCTRRVRVGAWVASVILSAGCGTVGLPSTPEELVASRATERLNAMLAGDFEKALGYTNSSFRQVTSADEYQLRYSGAANWTDAKVDRVVCEDERCEVRVLVSYRMVTPTVVNTRPLDQVWISVDGQWFMYEQ